MSFHHISVLQEAVLSGLAVKAGGIYVDGTLGGGGHALAILEKLGPEGRLIGIDRDAEAIEAATKRLLGYEDKVTICRGNFHSIDSILKELHIQAVDGICLDLGVSSHQLDSPERGFSYKTDAPLDMRMDRREKMTAADLLNTYSELELYRIIRDFGEEKFAKNIAKHIVRYRKEKRLENTAELVEIIKAAIPMKRRLTGGHPAKRTFQAIRIELNRELAILKEALEKMIAMLAPGGRLAVISFHSLEDRIVKTVMMDMENPCICPPDFPVCACHRKSKGKIITRKPVTASEKERLENSRAKSAKLRVFEKALGDGCGRYGEEDEKTRKESSK